MPVTRYLASAFRALALSAASLLTAGQVCAQSGPEPAAALACPPAAPVLTPQRMAQGLRAAQDHGPLWRLDKDGRSSWLYGTAHIARVEWVFPGPRTVQALRQSDVLALELNLLDAESLKPLTAPIDPASVQRVLDAPRRARLARQTALACLQPSALDALRPAMRAATLLVLSARSDGFYPDFGIDAMLAGLAQALKKPVVALESAADQLGLLAGRNEAEERLMVDGALDELESGKARRQASRLMQAWAAADMDTFNDYPRWCECLDTPKDRAFMKRLLDDRNVLMAQKIAQRHEGGERVFAGIGVLHMVGEQGLPALMRARGFRVEAVSPPAQSPGQPDLLSIK